MPLSEEEQRLLDEMERNLYGSAHDVHSAPGGRTRLSSRGILIGFVSVAAGLVLLVLGVSTQLLVVGVGGFVLMFAGIIAALSIKPGSHGSGASAAGNARTSSSRPKRAGFMARLEDRWDERNSM
jgi:uncharacterized membrane protein